MAHARRSLRNHHGKPHEHAPGDPLGEYLPPLSEWTPDASSSGRVRHWTHPALGWVFAVSGNNRLGYVRTSYSRGGKHEVRGANAHNLLREWYAAQTPASVARLAAQDPYAAIGRSAERNPDWSAIRAKASHYGSRAATGAREAYAWTAPRAKRAAEVTWEGAKSAGRAVKRGAKRAAPVVARGARSAAEGLDRWSQTNGRHNSGEPWGYYNGIQLNVYSSGGRRTEVYVSVYARGLAKRTPVEIVEAIHRAMGGNPEGNRISWDRSIDMKRLGRVVEKAAK